MRMIPRFACFARTAHFHFSDFLYFYISTCKKHMWSRAPTPPWKRTWHTYACALPFRCFLHPCIVACLAQRDPSQSCMCTIAVKRAWQHPCILTWFWEGAVRLVSCFTKETACTKGSRGHQNYQISCQTTS